MVLGSTLNRREWREVPRRVVQRAPAHCKVSVVSVVTGDTIEKPSNSHSKEHHTVDTAQVVSLSVRLRKLRWCADPRVQVRGRLHIAVRSRREDEVCPVASEGRDCVFVEPLTNGDGHFGDGIEEELLSNRFRVDPVRH